MLHTGHWVYDSTCSVDGLDASAPQSAPMNVPFPVLLMCACTAAAKGAKPVQAVFRDVPAFGGMLIEILGTKWARCIRLSVARVCRWTSICPTWSTSLYESMRRLQRASHPQRGQLRNSQPPHSTAGTAGPDRAGLPLLIAIHVSLALEFTLQHYSLLRVQQRCSGAEFFLLRGVSAGWRGSSSFTDLRKSVSFQN